MKVPKQEPEKHAPQNDKNQESLRKHSPVKMLNPEVDKQDLPENPPVKEMRKPEPLKKAEPVLPKELTSKTTKLMPEPAKVPLPKVQSKLKPEPPKAPTVKVQPKLEVNAPGDELEKEADEVAHSIVHSHTTSGGSSTPEPPPASENESGIRQLAPNRFMSTGARTVKPRTRTIISRKAEPGSGGIKVGGAFASKLAATKGKGSPLSGSLKTEMESGMGTDLSSVRLHHNEESASLSKQIHAKAFTHGSDIYFNKNRLNTSSASGKELLAHELTHTVQQRGGSGGLLQREPDDEPKYSYTITVPVSISLEELKMRCVSMAYGISPQEALDKIPTLKFSAGWDTWVTKPDSPETTEFIFSVKKSMILEAVSDQLDQLNASDFGAEFSSGDVANIGRYAELDPKIKPKLNEFINERFREIFGKYPWQAEGTGESERFKNEYRILKKQILDDYFLVIDTSPIFKNMFHSGEETDLRSLIGMAPGIRKFAELNPSDQVELVRKIKPTHKKGEGNAFSDAVGQFKAQTEKRNGDEQKIIMELFTVSTLFGSWKGYDGTRHEYVSDGASTAQWAKRQPFINAAEALGISAFEADQKFLNFIHLFEKVAVRSALNMLYSSRQVVMSESERYQTINSKGFIDLWSAFSAFTNEILSTHSDVVDSSPRSPGGKAMEYANANDYQVKKMEKQAEIHNSLGAIERALHNKYRNALSFYFPVMADPDLDLTKLAEMVVTCDEQGFLKVIQTTIDEKIVSIGKMTTQFEDPSNSGDIWHMDNLVTYTKETMKHWGVFGDIHEKVVTYKFESQKSFWNDLFLVLVGLLAALAAPFTAGQTLWISAAVGVTLGVKHTFEYKRMVGASNTDFDPSLTLSSTEPSLGWLIADWAFAAFDVIAAAATIKAVADVLKEFVYVGKVSVLELSRKLFRLGGRMGMKIGFRLEDLVTETINKAENLRRRLAATDQAIKQYSTIAKQRFPNFDKWPDMAKIGLAELSNSGNHILETLFKVLNESQFQVLGQLIYNNRGLSMIIGKAFKNLPVNKFEKFISFVSGSGRGIGPTTLNQLKFLEMHHPSQFDDLFKRAGSLADDMEFLPRFIEDITTTFATNSKSLRAALESGIKSCLEGLQNLTTAGKSHLESFLNNAIGELVEKGGMKIEEAIEAVSQFMNGGNRLVPQLVGEANNASITGRMSDKIISEVLKISPVKISEYATALRGVSTSRSIEISQLEQIALNAAHPGRKEAIYLLRRLSQEGNSIGNIDEILRHFGRMIKKGPDVDVVRQFLKAAGNPNVLISPEEAFRLANDLIDIKWTGLLPEHNFLAIVTKIEHGQVTGYDVSWLINHLMSGDLSPAAKTSLLNRITRSTQHFSQFRDFVETSMRSGERTLDEFLSGLGTELKISDFPDIQRIADRKGRNLAILEKSEPELVNMINGQSIHGNLSSNLQREIDYFLSTHIADLGGFMRAERGKIVSELNQIMAKNVEDYAEFERLNGILKQQGTRGSVFESWNEARFANEGMWGKEAILKGNKIWSREELLKIRGLEDFKGYRIDLDNYYQIGNDLIGVEFKNIADALEGASKAQARNYAHLVKSGQLKKVEYVFSSREAAMANSKLLNDIFTEVGKPEGVLVYFIENGIRKTL